MHGRTDTLLQRGGQEAGMDQIKPARENSVSASDISPIMNRPRGTLGVVRQRSKHFTKVCRHVKEPREVLLPEEVVYNCCRHGLFTEQPFYHIRAQGRRTCMHNNPLRKESPGSTLVRRISFKSNSLRKGRQ